MPNYDRTGPQGRGPMTGRGKGYCTVPKKNPKVLVRLNRFFGLGRRFGRGQNRRRNPIV